VGLRIFWVGTTIIISLICRILCSFFVVWPPNSVFNPMQYRFFRRFQFSWIYGCVTPCVVSYARREWRILFGLLDLLALWLQTLLITVNTAISLISHLTFHRCTCPRILHLHSRLLATDLNTELAQSHWVTHSKHYTYINFSNHTPNLHKPTACILVRSWFQFALFASFLPLLFSRYS
jgi:hypothetical protein